MYEQKINNMCGIFGEIAIRGSLRLIKNFFLNALDSLSHRGPDDKWYYICDKVQLVTED